MNQEKVLTYFAQQGEDGPIKIGKSKDPHARLAALQVGAPYPLRVLLIVEEPEHKLHRRFKADRLQGEWFRPSSDLLRYIQERSPNKELREIKPPKNEEPREVFPQSRVSYRDPDAMTPDERRARVASLLATAYLRLLVARQKELEKGKEP